MNNEQKARDYYKAINDKNWDGLTQDVSDKFKFVDIARATTLSGKNALKEDCEIWLTAFPDGKVQLTNVVAAGDYVIVEMTGRGTHTGPLGKGNEAIPPTNRKAEVRFCDVLQFKDGKLVSLTSYYDAATMLRQLGVTAQATTKPRPEARPH